MGYGHLRAATSVAEALGVRPSRSDLPPLAAPGDVKTWSRTRDLYEHVSRLSTRRGIGVPATAFLEWITSIAPLHPERDLSAPTRSAHTLERHAAQGFGRHLAAVLEAEDAALVSAFYAEAIVADRAGRDRVYCVVTDADVNRVWAPLRGDRSRIHYFAPTRRIVRRLRAYGVRPEKVTFTGFPLPPSLVGNGDEGPLLKNLSARLARLDPNGHLRDRLQAKARGHLLPAPRDAASRPPLVVFAIGGAGAQLDLARNLLGGMRDALQGGRLGLALVAGTRKEVAARLRRFADEAGVAERVRILVAPDFASYYRAFNALLAEADALWTKPGELVFYAGLGLPLVLAPAVGVQERANTRWVLDRGAAVPQGDPRHAGSWLREMIDDGVLAGAAFSGHLRLPYDGSRKIAAIVSGREERP
jgi:hypothetical protein